MVKKSIFSMVVVILLVVSLLSGCSSGSSTTESSKQVQGDNNVKQVKVGVVFTTAGLGGQSFNDLAFEGIKRAEKELGIKYDYVEPKSISDEEIVQDEMSSSGDYNLIICVGSEQIDSLKRVAAKYPNQKYALIDAVIDLPNIASYTSKDQEGSFLVGTLAAFVKDEKADSRLNDKKVVGFIGGVDSPVLRRFLAGYTAGVRYVDKDYTVLSDFVGSFNDPTNAKVISNTMYQKGADIIYHAAGGSGMGLFQAAKENNFIAIGVNSNQNKTDPDHIMASMLKLVDNAAYSVIDDVVKDKYKGGTHTLGIVEGGIGYTLEGSNIKVPQSIVDKVEQIKAKISKGELVIPDNVESVEEFVSKNQFK